MSKLQLLKNSTQNLSYIRNFRNTVHNNNPGWFDKGTGKQLDSRSPGKEIYELIFEDVKPEYWKKYVEHQGEIRSILKEKGISSEFLSTWKFVAGDKTSKSIQLVKYAEGWKEMDFNSKLVRTDSKLIESNEYASTLINSQCSEILKSYGFWSLPEPASNDETKIYEISTYNLKPGSMYDWTNYWARGLKCRQSVRDDIAYAGLFTQLGQLHTVYHIWRYSDYQDRSLCRKLTWQQDGWSEIVTETGELVTSMKTGILQPIIVT